MAFNLGASNNRGKLNMNDFLSDEPTVQNDEKEIHAGYVYGREKTYC